MTEAEKFAKSLDDAVLGFIRAPKRYIVLVCEIAGCTYEARAINIIKCKNAKDADEMLGMDGAFLDPEDECKDCNTYGTPYRGDERWATFALEVEGLRAHYAAACKQ